MNTLDRFIIVTGRTVPRLRTVQQTRPLTMEVTIMLILVVLGHRRDRELPTLLCRLGVLIPLVMWYMWIFLTNHAYWGIVALRTPSVSTSRLKTLFESSSWVTKPTIIGMIHQLKSTIVGRLCQSVCRSGQERNRRTDSKTLSSIIRMQVSRDWVAATQVCHRQKDTK